MVLRHIQTYPLPLDNESTPNLMLALGFGILYMPCFKISKFSQIFVASVQKLKQRGINAFGSGFESVPCDINTDEIVKRLNERRRKKKHRKNVKPFCSLTLCRRGPEINTYARNKNA
mmetsp:Transcript_1526/g.2120  ORF Transcript_1526/g.2120 Transcript_1526/m.2120 type:complete len:117 (-) Transcript_1526:1056-1406(-)